MCDSFMVDRLDASRVGFALRGMRLDSPSPIFSSRLLRRPWMLIPIESFLGLGLFPQTWSKCLSNLLQKVSPLDWVWSPSPLSHIHHLLLEAWYYSYEQQCLSILESLSMALLLVPNCYQEVRQQNIKWVFVIISKDDIY